MGTILQKEGIGKDEAILTKEEQKEYRSGTAVLLHMMQWTQIKMINAARECSRFMTKGRRSHAYPKLNLVPNKSIIDAKEFLERHSVVHELEYCLPSMYEMAVYETFQGHSLRGIHELKMFLLLMFIDQLQSHLIGLILKRGIISICFLF